MRTRKIFAVILSVIICINLFPAITVFGESNEIHTVYNKVTGDLTINLPASPQEEAWLVAASYNPVGVLVDVKGAMLSPGASTTQVIKSLKSAFEYKVFFLKKGSLDPIYPNAKRSFNTPGGSSSAYNDIVTAKGQVYVPMIDGAVAHSTAMAVDAYVEARMAEDKAMEFFQDTNGTYETGDNKTEKINRLAVLAESGTQTEKNMALKTISDAMVALEQATAAAAVLDAAAEREIAQTMSLLNAKA